jgi:putative ATP-binding cassette transporter
MDFPRMKLLDLLASGDRRLISQLIALAALSGGGSALLLAIVNAAAQEIVDNGVDQVDLWLAAAFAAVATLFFVAETRLIGRVGLEIENGIHQLRTRLLAMLARADYARIERFGQARLFESITHSSQAISQHSQYLASAFRSLVVVIAVLLYVLWLSPLAFVLVIATTVCGAWIYMRLNHGLVEAFLRLGRIENRMFERVADLFAGIREVRMWSARNAALGHAFETASADKRDAGTTLHGLVFQQSVVGMVAFYILLAVVVFVVPVHSPDFSGSVSKVATAVLFMIGPISVVVQSASVLNAAESAARRMFSLADELATMGEAVDTDPATMLDVATDFTTLRLEGVGYRYAGDDRAHGFQLGPLDLSIRRGEILFVTGGNGSGKSTFVKLLTGLYHPTEGRMMLDDKPLGMRNLQSYRHLIATVFSDFHLFSRLHGCSPEQLHEAGEWLQRLHIEHVTSIDDSGRISNTRLSQGQRKRLALVVAILEQRPILVLDEWAADQDPHFRRVFYREILPMLKARGITVIAVTHDDHYFDAADRRIHFENGRLQEQ